MTSRNRKVAAHTLSLITFVELPGAIFHSREAVDDHLERALAEHQMKKDFIESGCECEAAFWHDASFEFGWSDRDIVAFIANPTLYCSASYYAAADDFPYAMAA